MIGVRHVVYRVWAYAVGPVQSQSISAAAHKGAETDIPALLLIFDTEAERDRALLTLKAQSHETT